MTNYTFAKGIKLILMTIICSKIYCSLPDLRFRANDIIPIVSKSQEYSYISPYTRPKSNYQETRELMEALAADIEKDLTAVVIKACNDIYTQVIPGLYKINAYNNGSFANSDVYKSIQKTITWENLTNTLTHEEIKTLLRDHKAYAPPNEEIIKKLALPILKKLLSKHAIWRNGRNACIAFTIALLPIHEYSTYTFCSTGIGFTLYTALHTYSRYYNLEQYNIVLQPDGSLKWN